MKAKSLLKSDNKVEAVLHTKEMRDDSLGTPFLSSFLQDIEGMEENS